MRGLTPTTPLEAELQLKPQVVLIAFICGEPSEDAGGLDQGLVDRVKQEPTLDAHFVAIGPVEWEKARPDRQRLERDEQHPVRDLAPEAKHGLVRACRVVPAYSLSPSGSS
jgi:hypothetical protein